MTDAAGKYWRNAHGVYLQPQVFNPPPFQNANNSRFAIHHLGRMLTLEVYPTDQHTWRVGDASAADDGRHDRGEPVLFSVRGVWQPNTMKRGRGVIDMPEAVRTETNYVIHVDSHDPINLEAIKDRPDIFPDGLRLMDPDDTGTAGIVNFPMAVRFRGNRWKIKQPIALYEAGDEELDLEGAVYRAECQLWRDEFHERDARGDAPVWGPA